MIDTVTDRGTPLPGTAGSATASRHIGEIRGVPRRGGERRLREGRRQNRRDLRSRSGLRGTDPADLLGPHGFRDPGPVEHTPLIRLGDEVLGLVVVAVGGLHGPQVHGDPVLLRGHHAGQQIAVAGDEHDVGAGAVTGEFGQLGVHRRVDPLLRPAPVATGERTESHGHAGHHAEPAVLGLGHPVRCPVEPVDPQKWPLGVGFGALTQPLDEGDMIDGDPGPGRLPREETRGGPEQVTGVHQDDATVHAIHPLSLNYRRPEVPRCRRSRVRLGFPSSLPDHTGVNGPNSIFGVADRTNSRSGPLTELPSRSEQHTDSAYYAR